MVTGHNEKEFVLQARDNGINEYIVKPFNADNIQRKIKAVLENPRQFITSSSFTGPDRRRKRVEGNGPRQRRQTDEKHPDIIKTLQKEINADKK